eukprot:GHVR01150496.1.p1 GENE.GHVR01150496.1~~GHVR01150496.1.p1  ORF type:complete len:185 (-),score=21.76 GHVR01150496.1:481-1035(-)
MIVENVAVDSNPAEVTKCLTSCSICSSNDGRYKFRCCGLLFCSCNCFKLHDKDACDASRKVKKPIEDKREHSEPTTIYQTEGMSLSNLQKKMLSMSLFIILYIYIYIMFMSVTLISGENVNVRQSLENSKLRQTLLKLDSCPSSRKKAALTKLMQDAEFMIFANKVMSSIGGNGDFPHVPQESL